MLEPLLKQLQTESIRVIVDVICYNYGVNSINMVNIAYVYIFLNEFV